MQWVGNPSEFQFQMNFISLGLEVLISTYNYQKIHEHSAWQSLLELIDIQKRTRIVLYIGNETMSYFTIDDVLFLIKDHWWLEEHIFVTFTQFTEIILFNIPSSECTFQPKKIIIILWSPLTPARQPWNYDHGDLCTIASANFSRTIRRNFMKLSGYYNSLIV